MVTDFLNLVWDFESTQICAIGKCLRTNGGNVTGVNSGKRGTTGEGTLLQAGQLGGQLNALQRGTCAEGPGSDVAAGDGLGDGHVGQAGAVIECLIAN